MSGIFFRHGNGGAKYPRSIVLNDNRESIERADIGPILFPPPDGWGDLSEWPPENPLPPIDTPEWEQFQRELERLRREAEEQRRRSESERDTSRFGYMFGLDIARTGRIPQDSTSVEALLQLGRGMTEVSDHSETNSRIPPIYTYWGQFIDHDITANTDRNSLFSDITPTTLETHDPSDVVGNLRNLRTPALDLDSVYLDGPSFSSDENTAAKLHFVDEKFLLGTTSAPPEHRSRTERIEPVHDSERDLPRIFQLMRDVPDIEELLSQLHPEFGEAFSALLSMGRDEAMRRFRSFALIGDARNDENLNVAQFHLAVMRFHNAAVDWVRSSENRTGRELYQRARQLTRWHYQWLTVNDYLETVCQAGTVAKILARKPIFYDLDPPAFMPLEFSVAAFRFGHTMVRGAYDLNRNFGAGGTDRLTLGLDDLFAYTGGGANGLSPFNNEAASLPFDLVIEWPRFVDHNSRDSNRFTRKIDPLLADGLRRLNDGSSDERTREIMSHLAIRNLLRGYHLSIPSGQSVAEEMVSQDSDIEVLTPDELLRDNTPELEDAVRSGRFHQLSPLWFYVLKEAQVKSNGNTLGPVGSNIVAETIIGMLYKDTDSYLFNGESNTDTPWSPQHGVRLNGNPITKIRDFIRFGGVPA